MSDDRYDRVVFRGKTLDKYTVSALMEVEKRLGYELTIVQGSYNAGGVSASAGTHDGGGAVDLAAWDWESKVRVLRAVGFAAWYRPAIPGLWNAHIHAVMIGNERLSSGAANQVAAYRAHRDGLAGNAYDAFWRPTVIPTYKYPGKIKNAVQRGREAIRSGINILTATEVERPAVQAEVKNLRKALRKMPKK